MAVLWNGSTSKGGEDESISEVRKNVETQRVRKNQSTRLFKTSLVIGGFGVSKSSVQRMASLGHYVYQLAD